METAKQKQEALYTALAELMRRDKKNALDIALEDAMRAYNPRHEREENFFDAFVDVFTSPDSLDLYKPDTDIMARIRDRKSIAEYFQQAMKSVMQQEIEKLKRETKRAANAQVAKETATNE